MPMKMDVVNVEPGRMVECVEQAILQLVREDGDVVLDFSRVERLDAATLHAIQKLAEISAARGVKPVLRGVRVETYKVLKLMQLANRLTYEPAADA